MTAVAIAAGVLIATAQAQTGAGRPLRAAKALQRARHAIEASGRPRVSIPIHVGNRTKGSARSMLQRA